MALRENLLRLLCTKWYYIRTRKRSRAVHRAYKLLLEQSLASSKHEPSQGDKSLKRSKSSKYNHHTESEAVSGVCSSQTAFVLSITFSRSYVRPGLVSSSLNKIVSSSRERLLRCLEFCCKEHDGLRATATRLKLLLRLDLPKVNIVPAISQRDANPHSVTSSFPTITMAVSLSKALFSIVQLCTPP